MQDRRGFYRKGLHGVYLPYYDALCGLLGDAWQPICGVRTFEEQLALYLQGRGRPGPIVTWAKPGYSFHQYGLASDWAYFGGGHYTEIVYHDPAWKEYVDACEKVGVRCIEKERPHNEYPLRASVRELSGVWVKGGQKALDIYLMEEAHDGPVSLKPTQE